MENFSDEENNLTNKLIGKDFCSPLKGKPKFYKSLITQKEYSYDEYCNHGQGGVYRGFIDLPIEEYPYTVIYETTTPKYMQS